MKALKTDHDVEKSPLGETRSRGDRVGKLLGNLQDSVRVNVKRNRFSTTTSETHEGSIAAVQLVTHSNQLMTGYLHKTHELRKERNRT